MQGNQPNYIEFLLAPAKINLALHITGLTPENYHLLSSVVCFTKFGDKLNIRPSANFSLRLTGKYSDNLTKNNNENWFKDNILYKTKSIFEEFFSKKANFDIILEKNIPISAGLGGGSADSAAFLRFLGNYYDISLENLKHIALKIGADVPMCLFSRNAISNGIGEKLEFIKLPKFYILLINPHISMPTSEIFNIYRKIRKNYSKDIDKRDFDEVDFNKLINSLHHTKNDLYESALNFDNKINKIKELLKKSNDEIFKNSYSNMTGSGATFFSIYPNARTANNAYNYIKEIQPQWWVESTSLL